MGIPVPESKHGNRLHHWPFEPHDRGIYCAAEAERDCLPARYPYGAEVAAGAGIEYRYLAGLGGLRRPRPDSPNGGWRNTSFRGYADYMQTDAFAKNVDVVVALAENTRCALMCAEAVPWRCHRSLVADALVVRGIAVEEIIGPQKPKPHKLTAFARVDGERITYPSDTQLQQEAQGNLGF
jgi:hypothetical protein